MRPLAQALERAGVDVLVPDWDSTLADQGRAELLASLKTGLDLADGRPVVVIGWSLGGTAAVSLASLDAKGVVAVVGLATDCKARSPLTGRTLDTAGSPGVAIELVHGIEDTVVPVEGTVQFARHSGISLTLVQTDHAGVIGCEFDVAAHLCIPSRSDRAARGMQAALFAVETALLNDE